MSALEVQQLLARLYTEPELLREFVADREAFCLRYANGGGDLFRRIDSGQLEFFAESLRAKRAGEVEKLAPMTVQALGCAFRDEFDKYASTTLPAGARKHLADAMAFCRYLTGREERLRSRNQVVLEAAAFEFLAFKVRFDLKLEGESPTLVQAISAQFPWLRLKRFNRESPLLTDALGPSEGKNKRTRLTLFARLPGLHGIWYW